VPHFGKEFLCVQTSADVPKCGTYLSGLKSDSRGQVHLIYWAPGVLPGPTSSTWKTTLTIKAMKCSTSCSAGERQGESDTTLSVKPYPIYHGSGQLSAAQVQLMIDLVEDGGLHINPADSLTLDKMTEPAVEYLEATEHEALANLVGLPAAYGEAILEVKEMAEAVYAYGKEGPLGGIFLKALGLSAIGFSQPPFEAHAPGAPNDAFMTQIIGGFASAVITPGKITKVLYTDAEALAEQMKAISSQFATPPETVSVTVYEVSHCDLGQPNCGPGYGPGSPGIQPEVCLVFTGSDHITSPPLEWTNTFCSVTYDAIAWVESQKGKNTAQP
jgi:hypothetical protein